MLEGYAGRASPPYKGGRRSLKSARESANGLGEGSTEAANDSILAEGDHCVEEGRRDGLADYGDAGGVDEEAGFYASGFSYGAGGLVAGVVIPLGEFF